jgi:hypothetical protein
MTVADDQPRNDGRSIVGGADARLLHRDRPERRLGGVDPDLAGVVGDPAHCGWLVEVRLTIDEGPGFRFFAVGTPSPEEALEAILRFPGIFRDDVRIALRQLSSEEIARLELRGHGVRPYRMVRRQ